MRVSSVNSKYIVSQNNRFEGKYYLNDNSFLSMGIESHIEKTTPLSALATVFNPPVFKRQFCHNTDRAVPYFQSSDVPCTEERSNVFVFKGQAESLNLLVKKGDILVTGFGTIGNAKIVSKFQDGSCYANNVCRIRANEGVKNGVLYAFLASKYGYSQLNKNASGSVVRYIEAPGIKKTLIPNLPIDIQNEIEILIEEAIQKKEESVETLDQAKELIIKYCGVPFEKNEGVKTRRVKFSSIKDSFNTRLDPPVFINDGVEWMNRHGRTLVRLGDCLIKTWYPGIFKRSYVKDGYPYIKGSSLFDTNPFKSFEMLSKTRTPRLDELWLKEGMIMISCAGICGQIKLITKEYEDKKAIVSPDIIRLTSSDPLYTTEYLYAYLQIPSVYDYMQSMKYGSVIERFDTYNIENLPIIEPTKELSQKVSALIKQHMDCTYKAYCAEEKAIQMVEQEIEKWNK